MGHAATATSEQHEQHAAPNTYGGRVAEQTALPTGPRYHVDEQLRQLARLARRSLAPLSRVELAIARAVLLHADWRTGRCELSTMSLFARAACSRSQGFAALARLEGLGVIGEREVIDPCFADCRHVVGVTGWKGFRACNRLRTAARRAGAPFTCVAHHGRTTLRWLPRTLADLENVLRELEPKPVRRPAYRTPTRAACRTGVEDPYRTPHPSSPSPCLEPLQEAPRLSLGDRPGARARSAPKDAAPAARPAAPGSSAPPSPAPTPPPGAPRVASPPRAVPARPPSEPAFLGFAPRSVAPAPQAGMEGGRARAVPAAPPARRPGAVQVVRVDAAIAAHHAELERLRGALRARFAFAADPSERDAVAREFKTTFGEPIAIDWREP